MTLLEISDDVKYREFGCMITLVAFHNKKHCTFLYGVVQCFFIFVSRTHFVDAVYVLQLLCQVLGDEGGEADGRDVCDADPEDAPPEVEDAKDGKASAGNDDHDDAGEDAPEKGFPHDGVLFRDVLQAVFRAHHHGRDEAGEANADAVTDEGVDRNEGSCEEPPDDGADVA